MCRARKPVGCMNINASKLHFYTKLLFFISNSCLLSFPVYPIMNRERLLVIMNLFQSILWIWLESSLIFIYIQKISLCVEYDIEKYNVTR